MIIPCTLMRAAGAVAGIATAGAVGCVAIAEVIAHYDHDAMECVKLHTIGCGNPVDSVLALHLTLMTDCHKVTE